MADKRMKQKNDLDDKLLPSLEPEIECEICGLTFSDAKSYKNHLQGKKHKKKLSDLKVMARHFADKDDDKSDNEESDDGADSDLRCAVCEISCNNYVSYASHIKGSTHAKNVKKQKLKHQLGGMPEVLAEGQKSKSDDEDIAPKAYARCSSCRKEFFAPESFQMHLKSERHLSKIKLMKAMKKMKVDEGKGSDDEEFYKQCDVCHKSFSGPAPYHIHMKSTAHKKGVEKKRVSAQLKEFCANDDFDAGYTCKECAKTFPDPLGFKAHLENNSHEKQKAKKALAEFLKAYPEIVFVIPFGKEDSDTEDSNEESDSKYYLICKICNMSFSGPESAQDHVKSKKHVSTKKEKRLRELLKQQKTISSQNSDSKNSENVNDGSSAKAISTSGKQDHPINLDENNTDDFEVL